MHLQDVLGESLFSFKIIIIIKLKDEFSTKKRNLLQKDEF